MRPNSRYQEADANECRSVPTECLTAANGGKPIGPPQPIIQPPPPALTVDKPRKEHSGFNGFSERSIVHPMPINPTDICRMEPPNGRFCGFKVMYTYNKETMQCDEFWFPGCTTAETNANLFSDMRSCQKLAKMCKYMPFSITSLPRTTSSPLLSTTWAPFSPQPSGTLPPPAPTSIDTSMFGKRMIPNRVEKGGSVGMKGGGESFGTASPFGFGSALGGPSPTVSPNEGDGEDLGLFGLIQQSLKNAQAIKQGGPQGKQAAAAAAGQILQQFTGFDLNNLGGNFGSLFGK
ncbi:Kunitz/Bovine pancreatic trypsin inhibitor domain protein [Dictyocaulus viviparus]|uniref:Kunitz/Bovine pancreatic trypsin inhibitor domain protein n=1 Tax=Dictyocaulus viviparus TaxID=29172 RepID=A0A0D8XIG1_DICVI|nr:Kunitz/Bovine pancreatic trypsin inhibitor domain protein [Dictyocaulus viviparus]